MNIIENKLINKKIITNEDIKFLRTHIYLKNPNLSEVDKLKIISKAIIKVFDREYYWLQKQERLNARKNLLIILIKDGKDEVNQYDALKAVYGIITSKDQKELLVIWLEEKLKIKITIDQIDELFSIKYKFVKLTQKYKYAVAMIVVTSFYLIYYFIPHNQVQFIINDNKVTENYILNDYEYYQKKLHISYTEKLFEYKIYDYTIFKEYLVSMESKLLEKNYFQTIVNIARQYDVDPLLLFAIIGQEQSFVPRNNEYSDKIINNPYNVFNSWKYYNTSLLDTTKIASYTLNKILMDCPNDEDPFEWINKTYAEDEKWSEGVRKIYNTIKNKYVEIY